MSTAQSLVLSLLVTGFVFIALSIPLIKRRIKPNNYYGFRSKKALASDENWYAINHFGGKSMLKAGLTMLIGALFMFSRASEISAQTMVYVGLVFLFLPLLLVMFQVTRKMKEL